MMGGALKTGGFCKRWVSLGKLIQTGCAFGVWSTAIGHDTGPYWKWGSMKTAPVKGRFLAPSPTWLPGCLWSCCEERRHLWRKRGDMNTCRQNLPSQQGGRQRWAAFPDTQSPAVSKPCPPQTAASRPSSHLWMQSRSPDLKVANVKDRYC